MHSTTNTQNHSGVFVLLIATALLLSCLKAQAGGGPIAHDIDFQFNSLSFSGNALMPLGTDYGLVETSVDFSMSFGTNATGNTIIREDGDNDLVLESGENSFVESYFDVFFDITLTDQDAGADFANAQSVISFDNVSFNMGDNPFVPQCAIVADGLTFGGCGMLMAASSSGDDYDMLGGPMVLDLGFDINGDFILDQLTINSLELSFLGALTTSVVGGAIVQTYDLDAVLMGGINPDFQVDFFNGSAEVATIPVPAAVWLFGSGLIALIGAARRRI